jgi:hypothetical protein
MSRFFLLALAVAAGGCAGSGLDDGAGADAGTTPAPDLAPTVTGVGPTGGAVDRLFFAIHGDTRPPDCDQTTLYPTAIIQNIFQRERALGVQFAVDLGDHMYVCNNDAAEAATQMGYYTAAAQTLGKVTFMTMGNHECAGGGICLSGSTDANSTTFAKALAPISPLPYYSVDIATEGGKATFVFVADNAWSATQQQWLEATLARADGEARYTIVARHHPVDNTQLQNPAGLQIIRAHKYSLLLTGHSHTYSHDTWQDPSGRTLRLGTGGAPLAQGSPFYGFGTVTQGPDGALTVAVYDQATGNIQDSFAVPPQ